MGGERTALKRSLDIFERLFCAALFARMAVVFASSFGAHPVNILPVVSEALVVAFVIFRRPAKDITLRPFDWIIALAGSSAPLLAVPIANTAHALAPVRLIICLMIFGTAFSVWGKCALNVRFGVAAANRGVVERGPYAFLRHPIYLGYSINFLGTFLANPLPWNGALYLVTLVMFILRINAEERVLGLDPAYSAFMGRVRYRLAPGLY